MATTATVTVTAFDVHCQSCWWNAHIPTGYLDVLMPAHRGLMITAFYAVIDGAPTSWVCKNPRILR